MTPGTWQRWSIALLFLLGASILFKAYAMYVPWGVRFVFTASVPRGLYASKTYDGSTLERGQGVCFEPTLPAWAATRGYLFAGEVVCKTVLGVPGEQVLIDGVDIRICAAEGCRPAGAVLQADSKGRPMQPAFGSSQTIPAGHYYVGSTYSPKSFDSRYLGLIDARQIKVRTWPLWTY